MAYRISGTIIEAIFDDDGKMLRLAPKIDDFKVEKIKLEEGASLEYEECSNGGEGSQCSSDEECEEQLPPWNPWIRKCIVKENGGDKCICQYVPDNP